MALKHVQHKYVATMVAAGIGTAIIKSLIQGEDPSVSDVLKEATLKNGTLIPFADRLYKLLEKEFDPGAVPRLGGDIVSAIVKGVTGGKGASKEGIRTIRGMIPFMRMWYTQNAFDHLITNQLLEALDIWLKNNAKRKKQELDFSKI